MHSTASAPPQPAAASAPRHTTVLCAEIRGARPAGYLDVLGQAAELSGGRVLHRRTDGVLALFPTPNAAATAATRMHSYAQTLPPHPERTDLRIGLHSGPVAQRDQDIFGDTVNLALRLADRAKDGQVLVTDDAASSLSPALQGLVKVAGSVAAGAKAKDVLVGELAWREAMGYVGAEPDREPAARAVLQLTYRGRKIMRRREGDVVLIGRDADCDLIVEGTQVSRRHCTILRQGASIVLRDASTNGTYVTLRGAREARVCCAELALGAGGSIALGQPCAAGGDPIGYLYG
jgi:hypothetical protein